MGTLPHSHGQMPPVTPRVTSDVPKQMFDPHPDASATLLLVDDEPIILEVLQELLQPTGHRIITANNGREALDLVAHDPPDLILLDLMMPEMDGFEVCRGIKTSPQWWTIPIIVLTALDQPEDYARAIDCGADDFMSKPLNETILLARVRGYLHTKAATDALRRREAYTRLIIESAMDAIVTSDAQGVITSWNAQAEAIFGWPRQAAIGQLVKELIVPPRLRETHEYRLQRLLETGEGTGVNQRVEVLALHRDGHEFPVELALTSAPVGETQIFNAFIRDVTARQEAERALHQAKEAAEMANQAKSAFLANMSHELRTPMHGILSFASLGIGNITTAPVEKLLRYFENIQRSGHTLLALLNDLLDLSKLEADKLLLECKVAELGFLISTVAEELSAWAAERHVRIDWNQPSEKIEAEVDPERIQQVMRNLLSNAIKFSPPDGTITLDLQRSDRVVLVTVQDQGPGIPEGEQETVFDKFVQSSATKTAAGGTGLGLAICREIIALHQGRIWVENNSNPGAVFAFELPLNRQDDADDLWSCD